MLSSIVLPSGGRPPVDAAQRRGAVDPPSGKPMFIPSSFNSRACAATARTRVLSNLREDVLRWLATIPAA